MTIVQLLTQNILSFVVILSVIVFIHEFGHYYVARLCGVKVEEFSIGFGKELLGFNDKNGTRWKFCILPFGGYVKMFGDRNPASMADSEKLKKFTKEEKRVSFYFQNVYKRMAIVVAGPVANFILTILIFTVIFRIQGVTTILPVVDKVVKEGAAFEAGMKSGDVVTQIDDQKIKNFNEIQEIVSRSADKLLHVLVKRGEGNLVFDLIPESKKSKDFFGNEVKVGMIGVTANSYDYQKLNLLQSFGHSTVETYGLSIKIFKAIGELITGKRSVKELGGPVKIAQYSGQSVQMGFLVVLWFVAMISVNLGVLNLLPLPVLDGGHLFYYIIEAIRGKALSERIQQYGFQFGLSLLLALMLFTTYNDIYQIFTK